MSVRKTLLGNKKLRELWQASVGQRLWKHRGNKKRCARFRADAQGTNARIRSTHSRMQWLSLREPTNGRPYSSLSATNCRFMQAVRGACTHVHDSRGRWRVITGHPSPSSSSSVGMEDFHDCQTDTTLRSECHANTVIFACIIGESRECRSGADVQLQRVCLPRRRGLVQKHVSGEILLACSKIPAIHRIVHDSDLSFARQVLHSSLHA